MRRVFAGCLGFVLLAAGCTPGATTCKTAEGEKASARRGGSERRAVVVTIDGLLPDAYRHPEAHGLAIPNLRKLVAQGASSDGVLSVFPSVTYPSHTSMATGVVPGSHGITSNRSFDPFENDLEGWRWYAEDVRRDPIWKIADRAGYDVALVHWPVTVGAHVRWLVPEYWRAKNEQDAKVLRAVSTPGLLEAVAAEHPDFWPRFLPPHVRDDALADIAVHVLEQGKPHLLMLHFVGVDGAQHAHGVWSPEAIAAIEDTDRQLGRVLDTLTRLGLDRATNVLVASDHGFANTDAMVKPCVMLRDAGLVTVNGSGRVTDWRATVVSNSGQSYVYVQPTANELVRKDVRALFDRKAGEPGSGVGKVYDAGQIRALGGDPDAFLAIEAAPGFQFGAGCTGDVTAPPTYRATHGYDPGRPSMHASLVMRGPAVTHGVVRDGRLVDVGPTVASWLGLSMPNTDGKPFAVTPVK